MHFVAWDIETCPRPYESLSTAHQKRQKKEYEYQSRKDRDQPADEIKNRAGGTHPLLGWICCISMVSGDESRVGTPKSWTAAELADEKALLEEFWTFVQSLSDGLRWVTFYGKRFDVPFVKARSLKHGLAPTRKDILDTYPYSQDPHVDLANLIGGNTFYSLEDLCDHLDVESPKTGFDGSDVAPAVEEGRIDEVRDYCERDVVATLQCAQRAMPML